MPESHESLYQRLKREAFDPYNADSAANSSVVDLDDAMDVLLEVCREHAAPALEALREMVSTFSWFKHSLAVDRAKAVLAQYESEFGAGSIDGEIRGNLTDSATRDASINEGPTRPYRRTGDRWQSSHRAVDDESAKLET